MIFVSPETVVESIRPRVRVIQADGIRNFARELAISKPVFSDMDFRAVVNLLTEPRLPDKTKKKKVAPEMLEPVESELDETLAKGVDSIEKVTRKANFTRREWVVVALLVVGVIGVLIALIMLIIFTL